MCDRVTYILLVVGAASVVYGSPVVISYARRVNVTLTTIRSCYVNRDVLVMSP